MKLDFIECYANVLKTEGVEIDEIIQSQFRIENIAAQMLLMLEAKTALHCIEILGIMIHASDEICTRLVNDPDLHFLETVQ